jgi:hypothetical protein
MSLKLLKNGILMMLKKEPTMITIREARKLTHGDILHDVKWKNADGTPVRWRVNGAVKFWKTRPKEFRIPVKHGMYDFGYITHENAEYFEVAE